MYLSAFAFVRLLRMRGRKGPLSAESKQIISCLQQKPGTLAVTHPPVEHALMALLSD